MSWKKKNYKDGTIMWRNEKLQVRVDIFNDRMNRWTAEVYNFDRDYVYPENFKSKERAKKKAKELREYIEKSVKDEPDWNKESRAVEAIKQLVRRADSMTNELIVERGEYDMGKFSKGDASPYSPSRAQRKNHR